MADEHLTAALDALVYQYDPRAVITVERRTRDRDITVGTREDEAGTVSVFGRLLATDGALLEKRLKAIASTVVRRRPPIRRGAPLGRLGRHGRPQRSPRLPLHQPALSDEGTARTGAVSGDLGDCRPGRTYRRASSEQGRARDTKRFRHRGARRQLRTHPHSLIGRPTGQGRDAQAARDSVRRRATTHRPNRPRSCGPAISHAGSPVAGCLPTAATSTTSCRTRSGRPIRRTLFVCAINIIC